MKLSEVDDKIIAGIRKFGDVLEHLVNSSAIPARERAKLAEAVSDGKAALANGTEALQGAINAAEDAAIAGARTVATAAIAAHLPTFAAVLIPVAQRLLDLVDNQIDDAIALMFKAKYDRKIVGVSKEVTTAAQELVKAVEGKAEVATAALFQAKGWAVPTVETV
jgi:hypothetical protein